MSIYGTATLSICLLVGMSAGTMLGKLLGLNSDVGGVGIAMLLLIVCTTWMQRTGRMKPQTETGIVFWGSIYVPIVVAMAATQNVLAGISGGLVAAIAGIGTVCICFFLVAVLSRFGSPRNSDQKPSA
ncbi:MAG: malonate transporter subunit MadL [Pirellula sp.]